MCNPPKIDIKGLLPQELSGHIGGLGYEPYRAAQILGWIYNKYAEHFYEMSDLPKQLRDMLDERFFIYKLKLEKLLSSKIDKTKKYLFRLQDGELIESVLIPHTARKTACLSTQAGCAFACSFCATGESGFRRNLSASEIASQALFIKKDEGELSNIVLMGMGEPFANYDNTIKAVRIINAKECLSVAARRITISTSGVIPAIKRFMSEGLQVELSVSLHSADEATRSRLMPINKKYPLRELLATCREYIKKTRRQITFEYILIKGINDAQGDIEKLAGLLKGMDCKINLICYNTTGKGGFSAPQDKDIAAFKGSLERRGIRATIRRSHGQDISAACGQLKSRGHPTAKHLQSGVGCPPPKKL